MKRIVKLCAALLITASSFAQGNDPTVWSFSSKKKSDKVYEVVLRAKLSKPWHLYSQSTPDGGPLPTKITFLTNPLVSLDGKAEENGNLKTTHDETFGVDVKYFSDKVEFVQVVKIRSATKTNVRGTIEYMVCNDTKCLPPVKQSFDIKLE